MPALGAFVMKNSVLCAKLNLLSTAYDTTGWNPNQQMSCIVSNGSGALAQDAQVAVGDSVQLVSAYFQGAVFATNAGRQRKILLGVDPEVT